MKHAAYIIVAALSIVLAVSCAIYRNKKKMKSDVGNLVNLSLYASGIISGLVLVGSTFVPELRVIVNEMDFFIFVGGAAVVYVSVQAIIKEFKNP